MIRMSRCVPWERSYVFAWLMGIPSNPLALSSSRWMVMEQLLMNQLWVYLIFDPFILLTSFFIYLRPTLFLARPSPKTSRNLATAPGHSMGHTHSVVVAANTGFESRIGQWTRLRYGVGGHRLKQLPCSGISTHPTTIMSTWMTMTVMMGRARGLDTELGRIICASDLKITISKALLY